MESGANLLDRNLSAAFDYLDADGDGRISRGDLMTLSERVCERFGLTGGAQRDGILAATQAWWDQLAADCKPSDGGITRDEFTSTMRNGRGDPKSYFEAGLGRISEVMAEAIDEDGDGYIERDDYARWFAVTPLDQDIVRAAFERLDADGDGRITRAEFVSATANVILSDNPADPGTAMLGQRG